MKTNKMNFFYQQFYSYLKKNEIQLIQVNNLNTVVVFYFFYFIRYFKNWLLFVIHIVMCWISAFYDIIYKY